MVYSIKNGFISLFALLFLLYARPLSANDTGDNDCSESKKPTIHLPYIDTDEVQIDGKLDERFWQRAATASGFVQSTPNTGAPASRSTDVRIFYTKDALYVGAHLYDNPDSIAADLFRRDAGGYSDWFYVLIDGYKDRRTSYNFGVNPRGVRKDFIYYNDNNSDDSWDAVWKAEARIVSDGWIVELRIPLSQLRYNTNSQADSWGINFRRDFERNGESSYWSPKPPDSPGIVSEFGDAENLSHLSENKLFEFIPYTSGKVNRDPSVSGENPLRDEYDVSGNIGADVRYGISSDFSLRATINPDFGQVEVDPAVINLSAYETFYSERRPFFLEGRDIFNFGGTTTRNSYSRPNVFYSRRIGRSPVGGAPDSADYSHKPENTTIAGAAKLTGRTSDGWSIGFLNAATTAERVKFTYEDSNTENERRAEPPTNYMVTRVKKDFNEGRSVIGGFANSVHRSLSSTHLESDMNQRAYTLGFDFEHAILGREWIFSGVGIGSSVKGTEQAIQELQESSARYYQRPNVDYVDYDTTRTHMEGYFTEFSVMRRGDKWEQSVTYSATSPEFEVNDLGYMRNSDRRGVSFFNGYFQRTPTSIFQYFDVRMYQTFGWNYGGKLISNGGSIHSYFQFRNFWQISISGGGNFLDGYNVDLTRGGPIADKRNSWWRRFSFESDNRNLFSAGAHYYGREDEAGEYDFEVGLEFNYRPSSNISIEFDPQYRYEHDVDQYVDTYSDPTAAHTFGKRYVFADITQKKISSTLRVDWTLMPGLSVQFYAQPLITSGTYSNYKEFTEPGGFKFAVYGEDKGSIKKEGDEFVVDPDGEEASGTGTFTFDDPNFNFRSIRGNTVLRWEFRPGSTFYLVWQQFRNSDHFTGPLDINRDFEELFNAEANQTLMFKFSYWFS